MGLSNYCLGLKMNSDTSYFNYPYANLTLVECDSNSPQQKWTIQHGAALRNEYYGYCIDVRAGILEDNQQIIGYPCHSRPEENQRWKLPLTWACFNDTTSGDLYPPPQCTSDTVGTLKNQDGYCFGMNPESPISQTKAWSWVTLQECDGSDGQSWHLEDGQLILDKNPSGVEGKLCLANDNGAPEISSGWLYIQECTGKRDEKWHFEDSILRNNGLVRCVGSKGEDALGDSPTTQPCLFGYRTRTSNEWDPVKNFNMTFPSDWQC
ncbi:hypothetical protein BGZ91_008724 [Linnemannia elongata]|nr:hypothetical protein BGZ91_008724 [Linnemannia elongata]